MEKISGSDMEQRIFDVLLLFCGNCKRDFIKISVASVVRLLYIGMLYFLFIAKHVFRTMLQVLLIRKYVMEAFLM
jgi:hypothetical protein